MAITITVHLKADGGIGGMRVDGDDVEEVKRTVANLQDGLVYKKDMPKDK